ncbi:EPIDERMAL PATTERNING FACTOR-like protein 6 [Jatropha curcas]|uniref:EPIDERMAL PATTERNING FACTOR-like protein 6 n=1 Tax=Jatropha curcas TaxID=180498 RepID=UPI0005FC0DA0|nr:EPIDERMAL PATTERNING FACTOR-like protein 6 [Jatropha curcas]
MEYWKRKSSFSFKTKQAFPFYCFSFFFFFFSFCAFFTIITSTNCLGIKCSFSGKAGGFHFQDFEEKRERENMDISIIAVRRVLSGPGSSPPRCTSKCGKCTPCKPVHVPVPPGTPVTAEYYPEAWRCKCGNKLYMP